jgi:tRNA dimethylallyltransferase
MEKLKIIVICGPTAIGKTAAAIEIAKIFNGEIISADSMQVYRYMDIGTAKPTPLERAEVPHHLIDILNPDESFDAAAFAAEARKTIETLCSKGILPIVAGGTGLYIRALLHGIFEGKTSDPDIRKRLKEQAQAQGIDTLYQRLCECDPNTDIHPNDAFRIIRALEIFEISGQPASEHRRQHGFKDNPFDALSIALFTDREILYDRINRRVDMMIEQGLIDEVRMLLGLGYSLHLKSMQSIGYRHILDFMNGRFSYEETVQLFKRDTRRYAKRQITWFKSEPDMIQIRPESWKELIPNIENFLNIRGNR